MLAWQTGFFSTPPAAGYSPNGVVFDGSTYLTRGAAYSGAADSKLVTIAAMVKLTGTGSDQQILSNRQSASPGHPSFVLGRNADNTLYLFGQDGSTTRLNASTATALSTGTWYAILVSFDLANSSNRSVYINDALDSTTWTTYGNFARDFTNTENTVGTNAEGLNTHNFVGELSDVWFDIGRYVDFSVSSNRRLFFNASNAIVDKGTDGSVPFSAAPIAFFSGATASWATNKGTGGGMTTTGTLTTSSSQPPGA